MILVIGGTGKTGKEVLRQLAQRKAPARVLIHETRREPDQLGFETARGDVTNIASVDGALRGVDKLFLLTPPRPDEGAIKSAIVDAAKRSGVRHVVLLSGGGAAHDSPISQAQEHAKAEDHLKDSGLAFTILQPYFFMQNFIGQAAAIASQGVIYGNFGSGKLAMVDTRDIAAVAVSCLTETGHDGRTYVITGDEAITHSEAAKRLSTVLGKPISYVNLPSDQLVQGIVGAGAPAWLARDLAMLGEDIAAGRYERATDVVEKVTRRRPIAFEQFAKDNAATFR